MAHLGTISDIFTPDPTPGPTPLELISDYDVVRGKLLGAVELVDSHSFQPTLVEPVDGYVVRQIRTLFRQLWPSHGQRFPQ